MNRLAAVIIALLCATYAHAQTLIQLPIAAQTVADIGNGPVKARVTQGNVSIFTSQGSGVGSTSGSSTALTLTATPTTAPLVGALISGSGITSGTTVAAYNGTTSITLSAAMTVPSSATVSWGAACPSSAAGIPTHFIPASASADYYLLYTQARICAISPGGPSNALLVMPVFYDQTTPGGGGSSPVLSFNLRTGAVTPLINDYDFNLLSGFIALAQIPNSLVTYAKLQNQNAVTLLCNPTGSPTATTACTLVSGDLVFSASTVGLSATAVAAGSYGGATQCVAITVDTKGRLTSASAVTCTPAFASLTGSIAIGQIPNSLITYAKIQNETAATLLGNPTGGSATPSEISLGSGLAFSGSTLTATGSGSGLVSSTRTATSATSVTTGDCNNAIQAGSGSTGLFAVTLPAVAGFSANCTVVVTNGDTARGKQLIGFPTDVYCRLYPLQTVVVQIQNGAWATVVNPGRYAATTDIAWNVDNASGTDTCTSDGFGTGAAAFKTLPYAYTEWSRHLQGNGTAGQKVTATIADATLTITTDITISGPAAPGYAPFTGFKPFQIVGAGPFTTTVTSSTAAVHIFQLQGGAEFVVDGIKIASTGTGDAGCFLVAEGKLQIGNPSGGLGVNFDKCTNTAINAAGMSLINVYGAITVLTSGTYGNFAILESGARGFFNAAVTISGTPSWTTAFINADYNSIWDLAGFTNPTPGSPTGPKFNVTGNATIFTSGFGCTNLPGSTAGSTALNGVCQ